MYKEYPTFSADEILEYDRKSRFDDPLLSVDEQLEKHEKILDEYAQRYLGGSIPPGNKYREVGSGETLKSRPEVNKVLKRIERPDIKGVLVVDVQRLSRGNLSDAGKLIDLFRYSNTYVLTPHKIYDIRDEYDRDAFERELKRGNEYLEYYKKIGIFHLSFGVESTSCLTSFPDFSSDHDDKAIPPLSGRQINGGLRQRNGKSGCALLSRRCGVRFSGRSGLRFY